MCNRALIFLTISKLFTVEIYYLCSWYCFFFLGRQPQFCLMKSVWYQDSISQPFLLRESSALIFLWTSEPWLVGLKEVQKKVKRCIWPTMAWGSFCPILQWWLIHNRQVILMNIILALVLVFRQILSSTATGVYLERSVVLIGHAW